MSEVQVSYETRAYRYQCDVCGKGEMATSGLPVLLSSPPMFPCACTACGFTANLLYAYPRIEQVIGNLEEVPVPGSVYLTDNPDHVVVKRGPGRPPKASG